jgi:chromosomal replication initiator protein
MTDTEHLWQSVLTQLQLQMTRATFDTWLKDTYPISQYNGTLVIGTKNDFAKDWLENRLSNTINRTVTNVAGRRLQVQFQVFAEDESPPEASSTEPVGQKSISASPSSKNGKGQDLSAMLNTRYTFEQFIVGASNRLAHAASLAVSERPADAYNPLFLYGGVGLGKTHLLQAIAHIAVTQAGM